MVNWQSAAECKRCQYPLTVQAGAPVGTQPTAYSPGQWASPYAPPPPPAQFYRGPNPYEAQATTPAGVWRDDKTMVLAKNAPLPAVCVKCGCAVEQADFKRNFRWHTPALYLLLLISVPIYLIVALCVQKRATVHLGLCEEHRAKRRKGLTVGWVAFVLGLVMLLFGIGSETPALLLLGLLGFFAGLIYVLVAAHLLTPKKIDQNFVWLNGAHPDLLARLPQWPGQV
jgi:hypothetical protein